MVLPDVNALVYAHREDAPHHAGCRDWVEAVVNGGESYGLSATVLSGFVRVVTHPKVFARPSPLADALEFTEQLRGRANCVPVAPGRRHWAIFRELCVEAGAKGNLVPDAYLAAMAIEAGCEWVTTDRDFSRFKGLRWRHPLH
jgi:toxin-antitoxin system PIN domain toxin